MRHFECLYHYLSDRLNYCMYILLYTHYYSNRLIHPVLLQYILSPIVLSIVKFQHYYILLQRRLYYHLPRLNHLVYILLYTHYYSNRLIHLMIDHLLTSPIVLSIVKFHHYYIFLQRRHYHQDLSHLNYRLYIL